jgi:hypothetical protein
LTAAEAHSSNAFPAFLEFTAAALKIHKEKGPLASKRPKSREETPKEGGGTRRKSRTALQ